MSASCVKLPILHRGAPPRARVPAYELDAAACLGRTAPTPMRGPSARGCRVDGGRSPKLPPHIRRGALEHHRNELPVPDVPVAAPQPDVVVQIVPDRNLFVVIRADACTSTHASTRTSTRAHARARAPNGSTRTSTVQFRCFAERLRRVTRRMDRPVVSSTTAERHRASGAVVVDEARRARAEGRALGVRPRADEECSLVREHTGETRRHTALPLCFSPCFIE